MWVHNYSYLILEEGLIAKPEQLAVLYLEFSEWFSQFTALLNYKL